MFTTNAKVNYMKNKTYAKIENKNNLELLITELPDIHDNEVSIKVINCGICHSDISAIDNAWNLSKFPLVAGGNKIMGFPQGDYIALFALDKN